MRILNLAPHCSVPPMDGADRRAWHLQESMVDQGADSHFLGRNVSSVGGKTQSLPGKLSAWRERKPLIALASMLTGRNYWEFKMLTPSFLRAQAELRPADFDAVIVHFLYSLPVLRRWSGQKTRLIIETHNYDPGIYSGFRDASRNPVLRQLCDRAIRISLRALQALPRHTTLVHVSESDAAAYRKLRPELEHVVIENGCRMAPRPSAPDYTEPGEKQLLFVGSLSARMNQDALLNLSRVYWPSLRGTARMRVVGSLPPPAVASLCEQEGWELRPNVSDAELEGLYASAHYAVAPFAYGAGSKLKLMEACGRGVPMISTQAGVTGMAATPPCVHVTDKPEEWKRIVTGDPPRAQAIRETLDFAQQVSWPALGARIIRTIENTGVTTLA